MHKINIKRIYDKPFKTDGVRILVDRLWPRGISKDKAKLDEYFEKKYNQQNVNIDFIVLDEFLSTQQKTVETLSAKKKEIDQKYIAENNQNVLKELGYGDSLSN